MKTWIAAALPGLALAVAVAVLTAAAGDGLWIGTPLFRLMPYGWLMAAAAMGLLFAQSRVSFIAALMAIVLWAAHRTTAESATTGSCGAAVVFGATLLPAWAALFYSLQERGVLTIYGLRRAALLGVAAVVAAVLALAPVVRSATSGATSPWLMPMSAAVPLPATALLAVLGSACVLAIRKRTESPMLGVFLGWSVLFYLAALSTVTRPGAAHVFCGAAAGVALLSAVLESLWRHAYVDELTQLPSRRRLKHRFRCLGQDFAVAMLDLDHFKMVNDTYGHDVGDQVLRLVASYLGRLRLGAAYRYGGEEFVVIFEGIDYEGFTDELEQMRRFIAERTFHLRGPDRPVGKPRKRGGGKKAGGKDTLAVTVSIGVARASKRHASPEEVLNAADKALYRAKEGGRNRVVRGS